MHQTNKKQTIIIFSISHTKKGKIIELALHAVPFSLL